MMARRMFDGTLRLDVSPEEARLLMAALERESCHHAAHAVRATCSARDRRDLAAQVKRGAHANRRVAGELEAEAKRHADQRDLALDMQRVLLPHVSAAESRSNPQLPTSSQTEE